MIRYAHLIENWIFIPLYSRSLRPNLRMESFVHGPLSLPIIIEAQCASDRNDNKVYESERSADETLGFLLNNLFVVRSVIFNSSPSASPGVSIAGLAQYGFVKFKSPCTTAASACITKNPQDSSLAFKLPCGKQLNLSLEFIE